MRDVHVLNLGAGVQSTTLYLMFMAKQIRDEDTGIPVPLDCAIFADTGDEPKAVYEHLKWLQSLNGVPILVRSKGRLSDDLMRAENFTKQRFASIPAYTMLPGDDDKGHLRRQCSREYKVDVIERAIRRDVLGLQPRRSIPKSVRLTQHVGISLDEAGRFTRMQKNRPLGLMRAPLIEKFMTREACLMWLEEFGNVPHIVPRSACVFCPFHDDQEWLNIKAVPEDWNHAVAVDEALRKPGVIVNRNMDAEIFVHRSCQPLTQIDFAPKAKDDRQASIPFWRECLGVCGI